MHRIFREAATTVPYKDIFKETEWGCQWSESKCVVVVTVSLEILNILYTKINLSYKYIYMHISMKYVITDVKKLLSLRIINI
jgi:hypothetical protein